MSKNMNEVLKQIIEVVDKQGILSTKITDKVVELDNQMDELYEKILKVEEQLNLRLENMIWKMSVLLAVQPFDIE